MVTDARQDLVVVRTSVVIVSCREHPWLGASIDSVRGQTDEVVVVDNGSPGRWASTVARGRGARVVRLGRNRGFPAGVNAGVRAAGGDVIGLLNDDAFAGEGWLASAAAVLADGEVAAVAPKILFAGRDADVVNNAGSYLSQLGYGGDFGFQAADGPAFDVPRECFAACGAAMVFRAETFARVGGFAASFFAYYEDTDWCWRARLAGLRVRYEPEPAVRHVGGVTTGGGLD
ncbi:MAG: glycosyltransferase family 2 protein, partial [Acidimicrobiia bacterium]